MKPTDIGQTVLQQSDVMPHLLSLHVTSGCVTVSKIHGIGKTTALGVLKSGHVPPPLGNLSASQEQLVKQGTSFIGVCYGNSPSVLTMSEHRFLKWKNVTQKQDAQARELTTSISSI